jgi:hypothetical protein
MKNPTIVNDTLINRMHCVFHLMEILFQLEVMILLSDSFK